MKTQNHKPQNHKPQNAFNVWDVSNRNHWKLSFTGTLDACRDFTEGDLVNYEICDNSVKCIDVHRDNTSNIIYQNDEQVSVNAIIPADMYPNAEYTDFRQF